MRKLLVLLGLFLISCGATTNTPPPPAQTIVQESPKPTCVQEVIVSIQQEREIQAADKTANWVLGLYMPWRTVKTDTCKALIFDDWYVLLPDGSLTDLISRKALPTSVKMKTRLINVYKCLLPYVESKKAFKNALEVCPEQ